MQIGSTCFLDNQLRYLIEQEKRFGICDITGKENCIIYDTNKDNYLESYLEEILSVFTVSKQLDIKESDSRSKYLKTFMYEWNIFALNEEEIQQVMQAICQSKNINYPELFVEKVTIKELFSADDMNQNCILKTYSWEDFCLNIKHINRFHSQLFNFKQLDSLLANMVIDYPEKALKLYRARICDEQHYDTGYGKTEVGAPPEPYTTAGRTNSEGIQCLYLANSAETAFHEVRARDHDHITVGEFLQKRPLHIVDLSFFDEIGPFSIPEVDTTWFAINIDIIRKIGNEVAKPMRRFDKIIDYVPTQYICDYIKHLGYDGIKFKSTLVSGGVNYAIFDQRKFECVNVKVAKINNIIYESSFFCV